MLGQPLRILIGAIILLAALLLAADRVFLERGTSWRKQTKKVEPNYIREGKRQIIERQKFSIGSAGSAIEPIHVDGPAAELTSAEKAVCAELRSIDRMQAHQVRDVFFSATSEHVNPREADALERFYSGDYSRPQSGDLPTLRFFAALRMGDLVESNSPTDSNDINFQVALQVLRELRAEFPNNGVYPYFSILAAERAGEDPMQELDAFLRTEEFSPPERWIEEKTILLGLRSPALYVVSVGLWGNSDSPSYSSVHDWLKERMPQLDSTRRKNLELRLVKLMQHSKKQLETTMFEGPIVPYVFSKALLAQLQGRIDPRFPKPRDLKRNNRPDPDTMARAFSKLSADRCEPREAIQIFNEFRERATASAF